jgi:HAE1 family hydrophobic/amphiphilic exporter-1
MPYSGSRSCCTAFAKTYTYEFSGLTREEIIETKPLGCFLLSLIFVYFLLSPVRKLFSSAINSSFITGWCRWSYWFCLSRRIGKQYLLPGRFDHAYRVARQECHFDRRICHTKATKRNGFEAAIEGARARLRPILMTSLAFIFGLLPLALASE